MEQQRSLHGTEGRPVIVPLGTSVPEQAFESGMGAWVWGLATTTEPNQESKGEGEEDGATLVLYGVAWWYGWLHLWLGWMVDVPMC